MNQKIRISKAKLAVGRNTASILKIPATHATAQAAIRGAAKDATIDQKSITIVLVRKRIFLTQSADKAQATSCKQWQYYDGQLTIDIVQTLELGVQHMSLHTSSDFYLEDAECLPVNTTFLRAHFSILEHLYTLILATWGQFKYKTK